MAVRTHGAVIFEKASIAPKGARIVLEPGSEPMDNIEACMHAAGSVYRQEDGQLVARCNKCGTPHFIKGGSVQEQDAQLLKHWNRCNRELGLITMVNEVR